MCCIFTCCGWMIDLVQRAWVFAMSCCISSAICCFLLTASMSGVALGYNYSLAEYIELKETNVSVFLKRGVFDDEVVDEMDWRRGGGGPPAAERSGAETSELPASVSDFPFGFRRANDEGIFATTQINPPNDLYGRDPDHNRFEGSLLKLTSRPKNVAGEPVTQDYQMQKIMTGYPQDPMEQMRAMQGLMNRRKMDNNNPNDNKGFVVANFMTVVSKLQNEASTTPVWGPSEELQVIQKLLDERKEAALMHENLKKTTRMATQRPLITGAIPEVFSGLAGGVTARRMGDSGTRPQPDLVQILEKNMKSIVKEAPKWYQPRAPDTAMPIWTSASGPVTIFNFVTHTRRKIENTTPLSQESFRRAMQESSINRDQKPNEAQSTNEQQKDYDEEDVKGIPIRRKRKKRNKRNIVDRSTEVKEQSTKNEPTTTDIVSSFGNPNSVFGKLMAVLMNFKLMFATDIAGTTVVTEGKSKDIFPTTSSGLSDTESITASSNINIIPSAFKSLEIIKSSVSAF